MPPPVIGPCGGLNQPACPPQPAVKGDDGFPYWTEEQVQAHGQACYDKGREDATTIVGGICPVCSRNLNVPA